MNNAQFKFDNTYARDLEGFYVSWKGAEVPTPSVIKLNHDLAQELGLDADYLRSEEGAKVLAGSQTVTGSEPLAMAYAGHQFGGFSPQLGDGRAILLGEVINSAGQRRDIHLKGSGRTPFSRGGDGKAVLGPILREYLIGEAMHALGVPTTRALAAVTTGEKIFRQGYEPGAVLARVASSHLRIGTFQYFLAREEQENIRKLADYSIARHYPELESADNKYLALLTAVIDKQAALVAQWVSVGFVHGVMNTDNTTISGETIDYGPCAFIDHYDPSTVFSSIDQNGRYAYGNQSKILQWNLARFAETLLMLIDPDDVKHAIELAMIEIEAMPAKYEAYWMQEMRAKLGLKIAQEGDETLIKSLFEIMSKDKVDYTQFFRALAEAAKGNRQAVQNLFQQTDSFTGWLEQWENRIQQEEESPDTIAVHMNAVNPIYIPRNHKVDEALKEASAGNMAAFEELLGLLLKPYTTVEGKESFAQPAPEGTPACVTFCGT